MPPKKEKGYFQLPICNCSVSFLDVFCWGYVRQKNIVFVHTGMVHIQCITILHIYIYICIHCASEAWKHVGFGGSTWVYIHHLPKFMVNHVFFSGSGWVRYAYMQTISCIHGTWKQPSRSSFPSTSFAQTSDGLLQKDGTVDGSEILALNVMANRPGPP